MSTLSWRYGNADTERRELAKLDTPERQAARQAEADRRAGIDTGLDPEYGVAVDPSFVADVPLSAIPFVTEPRYVINELGIRCGRTWRGLVGVSAEDAAVLKADADRRYDDHAQKQGRYAAYLAARKAKANARRAEAQQKAYDAAYERAQAAGEEMQKQRAAEAAQKIARAQEAEREKAGNAASWNAFIEDPDAFEARIDDDPEPVPSKRRWI